MKHYPECWESLIWLSTSGEIGGFQTRHLLLKFFGFRGKPNCSEMHNIKSRLKLIKPSLNPLKDPLG